jgi:hypothetical protein
VNRTESANDDSREAEKRLKDLMAGETSGTPGLGGGHGRLCLGRRWGEGVVSAAVLCMLVILGVQFVAC